MAWRSMADQRRDREQRNRDQVQRDIRDAVQNNDGGAGWGFDDDCGSDDWAEVER